MMFDISHGKPMFFSVAKSGFTKKGPASQRESSRRLSLVTKGSCEGAFIQAVEIAKKTGIEMISFIEYLDR